MQSDKLPKMPDAPYWLPIGDRKSASIIDAFTAQKMQDYALAVRKAALEEVRAEMERRYNNAGRSLKGAYEAGEQSAYGEAECWVESLMEQDSSSRS